MREVPVRLHVCAASEPDHALSLWPSRPHRERICVPVCPHPGRDRSVAFLRLPSRKFLKKGQVTCFYFENRDCRILAWRLTETSLGVWASRPPAGMFLTQSRVKLALADRGETGTITVLKDI